MICWNFLTPLVLFVLVIHAFTQSYEESNFPAEVKVKFCLRSTRFDAIEQFD